jgi:cytochrome P450
MTTEEIIPTFGILVVGGSETTATQLSVATYSLLANPRVLKKLVDEVRSSFQNEDEITMVSVNKLKYELAVLEESMRIHAPVPMGTVRTTPPGGTMINGFWVPGGVSNHGK